MIAIRKAINADLPDLRDIAIKIYTDTFGRYYSPLALEVFLEDAFGINKLHAEFYEPGSQLYLACDDKQVVGFLRLRKNGAVDESLGKNHIELHQLFVNRDYHGTGVAGQLMKEALAYAKNCEWLWLAVWNGNLRAQRFYAKWGFEKFSEHHYIIDGEEQTDWYLRKRLQYQINQEA